MTTRTSWLEQLQQSLRLRSGSGSWPGLVTTGRGILVYQILFDTGDPVHLTIDTDTDTFRFDAGEHDDPDITLYLDRHETLAALLTGRLHGMDAFMHGRYRADGNIVLSQLLLYLFLPALPGGGGPIAAPPP